MDHDFLESKLYLLILLSYTIHWIYGILIAQFSFIIFTTISFFFLFAVSYMIIKLLLECSHLLLQILNPGRLLAGNLLWVKVGLSGTRLNPPRAGPTTQETFPRPLLLFLSYQVLNFTHSKLEIFSIKKAMQKEGLWEIKTVFPDHKRNTGLSELFYIINKLGLAFLL